MAGTRSLLGLLNIKKKMTLQKQIKLISSSDFFDNDWYLNQYPDVKKENLDPVKHYVLYGAAEGRNPGPRFDANEYLNKYLDVKQSGMNPLFHYLMCGEEEGRESTVLPMVRSAPEAAQVIAEVGNKYRELELENELLLLQLTQERDDQARLHLENIKWVESLNLKVKEKDLEIDLLKQQTAETQQQVEHWQQKVESMESQILEKNHRQHLLDNELVKAEAQIELIKDVLLREKEF